MKLSKETAERLDKALALTARIGEMSLHDAMAIKALIEEGEKTPYQDMKDKYGRAVAKHLID